VSRSAVRSAFGGARGWYRRVRVRHHEQAAMTFERMLEETYANGAARSGS